MSTTQEPNRIRRIASEKRLETFQQEAGAPLMSRTLERIFDEVSKDRYIEDMETPQNFIVWNKCNGIILNWSEPSPGLRMSVYGARIWRVLVSDDPRQNFWENDKKRILVWLILTNKYTDIVDDLQDYMYWVQWVNLDGSVSNPAGGKTSSGDVGNFIYLTDADPIVTNGALGTRFNVTFSSTVGSDRLLANPTNLVDGQQLFYRLWQDPATGGQALSYDTKFRFPVAVPALSTGAGLRDYLNFIYCEADDQIDFLGSAIGF